VIYLSPEVVGALGEDTFWTWFKREFPSSTFGIPWRLRDDDIVLRYSTLGFVGRAGKSLALLWELYPEMKAYLNSAVWDVRINKVYECARFSTCRTVASSLMRTYYDEFGSVDVLPIGVDADLFVPLEKKDTLRAKYGIRRDREVGIWCGTNHPMKGFDLLRAYASANPEIHWIVVWKWQSEANHMPQASNFVSLPQQSLCELMNAADFFLSTSRLRPFYMVEWEAMGCNVPMRIVGRGDKDFTPSENPRADVFEHQWDRPSAKRLWAAYLESKGVRW